MQVVRHRAFAVVAVLLFFAGLAAAQEAGPIPGRLLVRPRRDSESHLLFSQHGASVHRTAGRLGITVLDVDERSAGTVAESLRQSGAFEFVERDYYAKVDAVPNDASYASQWHLNVIQAPDAWETGTGSGVIIGIVDSGVDSSHPDLAGKVLPGWNFLKDNSDTGDVLGHGTAVAGVAAAITNNLIGIAGVAGDSQILPVAVVDSTGYASYSNIAAGIQYAVDHGARVVNVSIGGTTSSATLQSAVDYAWSHGAVVFGAAMNTGVAERGYPAGCGHAVAVSATDGNDQLAAFSSFGSWIAMAAPGAGILTTQNGGGYGYWSGTSFAAPIAAAVGALVLSVDPSLTPDGLVTLLEQSSEDLGTPGFDPSYGYGRVNAAKAVATAAAKRGGSAGDGGDGVAPQPTKE